MDRETYKRDYIQIHHVVVDYVTKRLPAWVDDAFEQHFLAHPELAEEVELTAEAQQALAEEAKERAEPAPPKPSWLSALAAALAGTTMLSRGLATASVAVLAVAGVLFVQSQQSGPALMAEAGTPRLVPILALRSATGPVIRAAAQQESVVLLVDPASYEYTSYRATVSRDVDGAEQQVTQVGGLEPGYESLLAVGVPGSLLGAGDYEVRIEGRMADWPAGQYEDVRRLPFRAE
jgi:hypothetical protein